jgi:hypothetical protein
MNVRRIRASLIPVGFWISAVFLLQVGCSSDDSSPATTPSSDASSPGADARTTGDGAGGTMGDGSSTTDDGSSTTADGSPSADGGTFTPPQGTPATVLLDGARLAMLRQQLGAGGSGAPPALKAAFQNLIAAATTALGAGTWSVTTKDAAYVANMDPHEYVSWGPYWWPPDAVPPGTPGTVGTCPYKQHDGIRNPNVDKITDRHGLHASSEVILQLALAWYFTGNPSYADQAERVARAWYLDTTTKMRPDMQYAQEHGPCGAGNAAGLIEASGAYMTDALDGLAILALDTRTGGWTSADQMGVQTWMTQFANWLITSPIALGEKTATNNHGTWYDALLSSIYLFTGDMVSAKALVKSSESARIDVQIMADGSQPLELSRTTCWHYSNYNLAGLCRLAGVAKHVGVDLWGYKSGTGGSIGKALDFLIPTAKATQPSFLCSPPPPTPADGGVADAGPTMVPDIVMPFDSLYQGEAFYTIHAAADVANDAVAQAVFSQNPVPVQPPGSHCSGDRFPAGSDFCAITPGNMSFADLQAAGTPAVDMWPLLGTCRVPIN